MAHHRGLHAHVQTTHTPLAPASCAGRLHKPQAQHQRPQQHHTLSARRSVAHQRRMTAAQVAAVPAFVDDGSGAVAAAAVVAAGPALQSEQQQQPGWLPAAPWQQPRQAVQQQQQELHQSVSAALSQQQVASTSASQEQQEQQQEPADPLLQQLRQCSHVQHVAALMSSQPQEQLDVTRVHAILQRLCDVRPAALPARQQQQLQACLSVLADAALAQLPALGHAEVGQLLARMQQLGFRPPAGWMRSVLQHAGTELVHYTPAELSLLLLTATQTAARHGAMLGPDSPVVQLLPTQRVTPLGSYDGPAMESPAPSSSSTSAGGLQQQPQLQQEQAQQQQQQRRANTVLTSAWLQLFLTTFQPYIACRSAHPQLSPGHMEAVITCLAGLRVAPDRFWLYLFVRQMSAQLPHCSTRGIVRMLSALATLGYRLPDHVLAQVERQIGTDAAMAQLRAEECVDVVRSVAVLRAQQSRPLSEAWLQQLLAAALRGNAHLSASAVIGLLAATAALGMQLERSWVELLLLQARGALGAMTPHEHVWLMDALAQQQQQHQAAAAGAAYRPGPAFMAAYMARVAGSLPALSVSQQAALAAGLAAVGYKPSAAWMGAFISRLLGQRVGGADGEPLLRVLRALRRMQYVPAPRVAQQLSGLIDAIQLSVPYQQLLLLREALDELQYQRGVMAVPAGPRRAAEAAAAAAEAQAAAAAAGVEAEVAVVAGVSATADSSSKQGTAE